ncbi:MAG: ABC transporter substrate-binding protein [Deltaproteobacteria bacterium]|nr:MAG: ABC transporter substrate-binding protein [Deltaproteobacteria bacterium]TMB36853.1 MAG: ABC transporter substrate-binding protein [Deltaproteobacteria bacterium]
MSRLLLAGVLVTFAFPVSAEVNEVQVAQQYGVSFLPLMLMERDKLVEKHAKAAGLPELRVNWAKVAGPSIINDGLISGSVHFAATGAPSLITLWDKTNGVVKGMSAMTTYPLYLVTRNAAVKSIEDFSEKDKIALPSIKVSTQAIVLQMAAAKAWGQDQYARLDPFTIGLSHPDAMLALMSGTGGVNSHFSTSPFYEQEIKVPGVRTVTTSYEILGGRATALVITASSRFREANPKTYRAFFDALSQSIQTINKDKRAAAKVYLEQAQDKKNTVEDIVRMIDNPDYEYTLRPEKVFKTAVFMNQIGSVKRRPASVRDLFFPEVHPLGGD